MKGVINKGIQELVEARFGEDVWREVRERAECEEPFFAVGKDYPDEMTLALVEALAEVAKLPPEVLLVEFGKFWVPHTGLHSYPTFYKLAGSSPREFLLNMDRVHRQATRTLPGSKPPHFTYEERDDGRLLMHYHSSRNLCKVLQGLILGVGLYFQQHLEVHEVACRTRGDPHCTFEVCFP
ncbi:MAG: heme NO-binding domain-containing protein [Planctomycetota bacterium]